MFYFTYFGITFLQQSDNTFVGFGIVVFQNANRWAACVIEIAFLQIAKEKAYVGIGIPLSQTAENSGFSLREAASMIKTG